MALIAVIVAVVGVLVFGHPGQLSVPSTTPPARTEASPYGVLVTGIDQRTPRAEISAYMQRASDAGAAWIRTDFWWYSVEWFQGQWDWHYFDYVVQEAIAQGLQVIPILWGTPHWAATDGVFSYGVPDMAAWERFVFQTVSRYRGRVVSWEVWNEPNLQGYWRGTPGQYAELLARAYTQIKRADPRAFVLLGGLALGGGSSQAFLQEILRDGTYPAGAYFDIHNVHIAFSPMRAAAGRIQDHVRILDQHGLRKEVVVTELSYTSDPTYQNVAGYTDGEAGQARYVRDAYQTLLENGVTLAVWAALRDYPKGLGEYTNSGLLRTDLTPKAAFVTYQQMARSRTTRGSPRTGVPSGTGEPR